VTRATLLKLSLLSLILSVALSALLLQFDWLAPPAATAAEPIDRLLDVVIVISSFVFVIVMVGLFYALWKWRAKPGDESDGEPIHGNTKLEIIWTLIPTIIVLGLAGYSWAVVNDIEKSEAAEDQVSIDVVAQQYKWTFVYNDAKTESGDVLTTNELHVPVGKQLRLKLTAIDVIHSFWVPEWRVKRDLVPKSEHDTSVDDVLLVTPDKVGTYQLVCTELCGWGHATMRALVVVHTQEDYDAWLAEQQANGAGPEIPVANDHDGPGKTSSDTDAEAGQ